MRSWLRTWLGSAIAYSLAFTALCLLIQVVSGGYQSDRGQTNDEAAHFVSSLMIFDYVFGHLGENPMSFAKNYYAHFPRVAIGHWPPVFELTQAVLFLFGRNGTTAMVFQAVVAGLAAGLPAAVVSRRAGPLLGLIAGAIVFLSPFALFLTNTVMADNFLAVLVFATGLAWDQAYKRATWGWCLCFAGLASAAIMTKGNGFGLALLPPLYLLIKRDLGALFKPKIILSGLIVGVLVVPWYVATYKYAASGWRYTWGWSFTSIALPGYLAGVVASVGLPVALGYVLGIIGAFRRTPLKGQDDLELHAALSLAMLIFAILAPADITPRYLIPALPSMSVVALFGLWRLADSIPGFVSHPFQLREGVIIAVVLISIATIFEKPHVEPFNAARVVALIEEQKSPNPLVLTSGSVRFEGSMIAAFAEQESTPVHFVVRGTKVLASGDFMGFTYKARFQGTKDMKDWILANQIGYVVISDNSDGSRFSHNATLRALLGADGSHFKKIGRIVNEQAYVDVYSLPADATRPKRSDPVFSEIALDK